jgi:HSP20 family molecular chaperone IbpA
MTTQTETNVVKQPAPTAAPQRPVTTPRYQVAELEHGAQVQVFLPGIDKSAVETTVEHNRLVVRARQTWSAPASWAVVHRESKTTDYHLILELDPMFDQSSVAADLANGVLNITIAKQKALKPRKIEITN